jgi:hypothetical protein
MKIKVYVSKSKDGYPRADADVIDVAFIYDLPLEMTSSAKEQAKELKYKIESAALDYVEAWSLTVPTTILVDLDAVGVEVKE